jgi:uncharacterized C2H2 Zn-finger protein
MSFDDEDDDEVFECPYCGEIFDSLTEEGVHRAEEHTDTEDSVSRGLSSGESLIDEWD